MLLRDRDQCKFQLQLVSVSDSVSVLGSVHTPLILNKVCVYLKLSLRFSGEPSIWKLNCSLKSPRMELLKVTCMAWCPSGITIPSDGLKEKRGPNRLLAGSRLKIASMSPLFASTTSYVCDEFTKMFPMSSLSNENCTLGPIPTPWMRSGSRDSLPVTSQNAVHVYC